MHNTTIDIQIAILSSIISPFLGSEDKVKEFLKEVDSKFFVTKVQ